MLTKELVSRELLSKTCSFTLTINKFLSDGNHIVKLDNMFVSELYTAISDKISILVDCLIVEEDNYSERSTKEYYVRSLEDLNQLIKQFKVYESIEINTHEL